MGKKVLILTADVAGGHRATAKAITEVWQQTSPQDKVKTLDVFVMTDVMPFNTSNASYELFSRNNVLLFMNNFFFALFNTGLGYEVFRRYVLWRLYYPTLELIEREQPDIIICNHPIVNIVISHIRERAGGFRLVTLVVDIGTIWKAWAEAVADLVISPAAEVTDQLVRHGLSIAKIVGNYFPLKPSLSDLRPKAEIAKDLGIDSSKPVILLTGGGNGTSTLVKAVDYLLLQDSWQIVIVCGRLSELVEVLQQKYQNQSRVKILGFVERMQDMYQLADVVIAKPGPTTVIELELFQKKAILTKEIGGQEFGNVEFAEKLPTMRSINGNWRKLPNLVEELLAMPAVEIKPRNQFDDTQQIVLLASS